MTHKILVVDDEEIICSIIKKYLENIYEVKTASSGEDALIELKKGGYHVVITDAN